MLRLSFCHFELESIIPLPSPRCGDKLHPQRSQVHRRRRVPRRRPRDGRHTRLSRRARGVRLGRVRGRARRGHEVEGQLLPRRDGRLRSGQRPGGDGRRRDAARRVARLGGLLPGYVERLYARMVICC